MGDMQHRVLEFVHPYLDVIIEMVELVSVVVIVFGLVHTLVHFFFIRIQSSHSPEHTFVTSARWLRIVLAAYILFALEILIVADLISIILSSGMDHLIQLAIIVVIRILIEFSLSKEVTENVDHANIEVPQL